MTKDEFVSLQLEYHQSGKSLKAFLYEAAFNVSRRRLRRLLKAASSANEAAFIFLGNFCSFLERL